MTEAAEPGSDRFDVRTTAESHFSWLRTRLSLERTLMSWVRTGAALIGFGFTIFQFLERLGTPTGVHPMAPWIIGLSMVGAGVLALLIATRQYLWVLRYLWSTPFKPIAGVDPMPFHSVALAVTVLLAIVGVFAFGAVFLRIP